jgi:hypothetical protein
MVINDSRTIGASAPYAKSRRSLLLRRSKTSISSIGSPLPAVPKKSNGPPCSRLRRSFRSFHSFVRAPLPAKQEAYGLGGCWFKSSRRNQTFFSFNHFRKPRNHPNSYVAMEILESRA